MAYCWFWFIQPATAMTMNRNGFKMFRIPQLIMSLPEFTARMLCALAVSIRSRFWTLRRYYFDGQDIQKLIRFG
jgi:hypothetical protein